MSTQSITCLVAVRNAEGSPEIVRCQVRATPEEIKEGEHHTEARTRAEEAGYTVFPTDVVWDSDDRFCHKLIVAGCYFDI
jgi:hypothetical protein